MEAVFSVIFSDMVTSDDKKYGPPGVVSALMSWPIAIGVVIILGAVAGIVWRERNLSFRAALKKLPPPRIVSAASRNDSQPRIMSSSGPKQTSSRPGQHSDTDKADIVRHISGRPLPSVTRAGVAVSRLEPPWRASRRQREHGGGA